MTINRFIIATAFAALAATPVVACDQKADFYEDFAKPDPGWGQPTASIIMSDGTLTLKPGMGNSQPLYNGNYLYSNATMCVDFVQPQSTDPSSPKFGLEFWHTDANTYFVAIVSGSGQAFMYRHTAAGWLSLLGPIDAPSYRKQVGASNEMLISVTGPTGSMTINGVKVTDFRGQAPKGQWSFGVYGEAGSTEIVPWVVTRAAVTELP